MVDVAERKTSLGEREEKLVESIISKIDISDYLEKDFVDVSVSVIPNKLEVTYRSPFGGEVFDAESEVQEKKIDNEADEYHYRVFRSLAASVQALNGKDFMPGASVPIKLEGLKKKPKHILDRLLWGHVLFNEALRRVVEDPEIFEDQVKKS
jgi:hypothetical protein